jgi:phage anti-repressor protein
MDNIIKQEILTQLESNEQFTVDFDIYWKWLNFSSKGNAKRAFEKSGFIIGKDFNHVNPKENVVRRVQCGGTQFEKLMLTIDCAKFFAVMARTEKGRAVRIWYLESEKEYHSQKLGTTQLELEVSQQLSKVLEVQYQMEFQQRALLSRSIGICFSV